LGAVFALDPVAGASSAVGFVASVLATRYVSVSSVFGGIVFAVVHFLTVSSPLSREQRAMSLLTAVLLVLLVVRHRKNFERLRAGTEPKVNLSRRKPAREGKVSIPALAVLVCVAGVLGFAGLKVVRSLRTAPLVVGGYVFEESARVGTGHQRAERVAFAEGGKLLAVTCPRYNRLVLYRVTEEAKLAEFRDIELEGKPVAVCAAADRLYVLERPAGDQRHVQPGWWETFSLQGEPVGQRVEVGFYPDDLALSRDGRHAFVLGSGRAEGGAERPAPGLDVYEIASGKAVGRVELGDRKDDPVRLTLSGSGQAGVITLMGSNTVASVDLFDPANPRLIGRAPLPEGEHPYASRTRDDWVVMPAAQAGDAVVLPLAGFGDCLATSLPHGSAVEIVDAKTRSLGRLTLRGGLFGTAAIRPTGLDYSPERGLLAVSSRSGGVHLVTVRSTSAGMATAAGKSPGFRGN
ncbi:MAG: glycerol-3-phosphate acyltransferase, partial [Isosphaeraceae bacterium]